MWSRTSRTWPTGSWKTSKRRGKGTSGKKLKQSGDPSLYAKGYLDGKSLGDNQKAITA